MTIVHFLSLAVLVILSFILIPRSLPLTLLVCLRMAVLKCETWAFILSLTLTLRKTLSIFLCSCSGLLFIYISLAERHCRKFQNQERHNGSFKLPPKSRLQSRLRGFVTRLCISLFRNNRATFLKLWTNVKHH